MATLGGASGPATRRSDAAAAPSSSASTSSSVPPAPQLGARGVGGGTDSTAVDYQAVDVSRWVIHRSSCGRVVWDYVITVLAMFSSFEGPLSTARNAEHYAKGYELDKGGDAVLTGLAYFSLVVDLCFLLDVGLNFFTSYFAATDEVEVYNLKMIARQYVRRWFLVDLLCSVPFELIYVAVGQDSALNIVSETLQAFFRILKIFKIIRLTKLFKQGDESVTLGRLMYMRLSRNQRRILALLIAVLFISHFIACLWVTEVNLTLSTSFTSWSKSYGVENEWVDEYVAALYWVVQTMTTVGYGDVEPANQLERLIATMVMVVSAMFWGYIVASMASIISSFSAQSEKAEQYMEHITHYLKEKGYPKLLALKVQRYYRHYYYKSHSTDEVEFMQNLSPTLQTEVGNFLLGNMKGQIVASCSILRDLDRRELSLMTMIMKPQFFEPNVPIVAAAARVQQIFFVLSGDIFVLSPLSPGASVTHIDVKVATAAFHTCREARSLSKSGGGAGSGDAASAAASSSSSAAAAATSAATVASAAGVGEAGAEKEEFLGEVERRSGLRWKRLKAGNFFGAHEALSLKPARLPVITTSPSDLFTISRRDLDTRFRLHPEVLSSIASHLSQNYNFCLNTFQRYPVDEADRRVREADPNIVYMQECIRHRSAMYQAKLKTASLNKNALLRFAKAAALVSRQKSLVRTLTEKTEGSAAGDGAAVATEAGGDDEATRALSGSKSGGSGDRRADRARLPGKINLEKPQLGQKRLMQFATQHIRQYVGDVEGVPAAWTFLEVGQKLFQVADTEESGLVEADQFVDFLVLHGALLRIGGFEDRRSSVSIVSQHSVLVARAQSIYTQIDDDNNGMIDESEFLPWVLRIMHALATAKKSHAIVALCRALGGGGVGGGDGGGGAGSVGGVVIGGAGGSTGSSPVGGASTRSLAGHSSSPGGGEHGSYSAQISRSPTTTLHRGASSHNMTPLTPHLGMTKSSFRRQGTSQSLSSRDVSLALGSPKARESARHKAREAQRQSAEALSRLEGLEAACMQALGKIQNRLMAYTSQGHGKGQPHQQPLPPRGAAAGARVVSAATRELDTKRTPAAGGGGVGLAGATESKSARSPSPPARGES